MTVPPASDPKQRYRRIELAIREAAGPGSPRRFAERLLPRLLALLGPAEGVVAADLLQRRGGNIAVMKREGLALDGPALSLAAGDMPWAGETDGVLTAAFELSPGGPLVVALRFAPGRAPADPLGLATALHYAVAHELGRRELENEFEQARAIQTSLLPAAPPAFDDMDVAAFTRPASIVGGDVYDFLTLDAETLGIVIADASGHGLPAALQARDVVTGLRMGVERDLRLTRTVEKLNRVIHRSGLTTRFISMVFGELERNGNLVYVNAGHPPPLLLDESGVRELTVGGGLLGPYPDATYKMGFAHLDRGARLLFYTDGVIEAQSADGEMFGRERLERWLVDHANRTAEEALGTLVAALDAFTGKRTHDDDVTAVYVRRPH
jgi:sigma-B regulation protein RsbU (phosphoserine phosphatase)